MNELTISLCLPEKVAEICRASIALENYELGRSKIEVSCTENGLKLYATASDLSAMRAVLNTYMRWIIMCRELIEN
jgi:tRNA threonylcarbamoyladenosine modification (KEOPS) complex  Pcc1 subunit